MFYKTGVDIANTKSMWNFLHEHDTYHTMNAWNRCKSVAHNVKLYNLNLDGDWTVAMRYLFDEADSGCLQMNIDDAIAEFEEMNPHYRVFFNGRSGGYIVLGYDDNNGSVLPECVTDYDSYEDFKEDIKASYNGYNVTDFYRELREAVEIVREFDKLCDRLRDIVNDYSKRSFDVDKLESALNRFNDEYSNDLDNLNLEGPSLKYDRVVLNDIADYNAFMKCFLECLGEDRKRATGNGTHLWLAEI